MAAKTAAAAAAAAAAAGAAATVRPISTAAFAPRTFFEASENISHSYFLGHHVAALRRMKSILSNIGLVIECRDLRVPLTSWNPLLERHLAESGSARARILVYTKADLAFSSSSPEAARTQALLRDFHRSRGEADRVIFTGEGQGGGGAPSAQTAALLHAVKEIARATDRLTGLRALVVGMPNAGKSTLLNALRRRGVAGAKASRTGAQPGVTRAVGTPVRITARDEPGLGEGVYVMDTPGVFVPYVADSEAMARLALVGCVKDGLVDHVTVADYLLFHVNLRDPGLYAKYCAPTNDVHDFLAAVARRTGKLEKGGGPSLDRAADWVVQQYRAGAMGRFVLDRLTPDSLEAAASRSLEPPLSLNQARKREKEMRKVRQVAKMEARRANEDVVA